ncbi:MAG: hypothetical protein Q9179_007939 [Wetmoreana sp. 5 TL-2023]
MKVLLDRADAALKLRLSRLKQGEMENGGNGKGVESGMEGLVDEMNATNLSGPKEKQGKKGYKDGVAAAGGGGGDEWEVLSQHDSSGEREEQEVAIRVDQYLVVFVKFLSTMTPSIEHDYTMGI